MVTAKRLENVLQKWAWWLQEAVIACENQQWAKKLYSYYSFLSRIDCDINEEQMREVKPF